MKTLYNRININPKVCNGKPTIHGTRITVQTILEYLAAGESFENLLKAYPDLEREDILACLELAAAMFGKSTAETLPY